MVIDLKNKVLSILLLCTMYPKVERSTRSVFFIILLFKNIKGRNRELYLLNVCVFSTQK